nr:polyprotein [Alphaendornavirus sp.]
MPMDLASEIFDAINQLLGDVKTKLTTTDNPVKGRVFTWGHIDSFAERCLMVAATPMINWKTIDNEPQTMTNESNTTNQSNKSIRKPNEIQNGLEWITHHQQVDEYAELERTLPGTGYQLKEWAKGLDARLKRRLKAELKQGVRKVHNEHDLEMLLQQAMGHETVVFKSGLVKQRLTTSKEELMRNPFMTEAVANHWVNVWSDIRHAIEFSPTTGLIINEQQLRQVSSGIVATCLNKARGLGCIVTGIPDDEIYINRRRGALSHQNKCMISMPPKTGKRTLNHNHPWIMTQDQMNLNDKKLGGLLLTGEPSGCCMIPESLDYHGEQYHRREGFMYFMMHATNIKLVTRANMYATVNDYHNNWLNNTCLFYKEFEKVSTQCGFEEFDKHKKEYETNYQHQRDAYLAYHHEVQAKMEKKFGPARVPEDQYRYRTASVLLQDDGGKTLLCKVFPDDFTTATMLPESHTPINDASYSHGVLNSLAYTKDLSTLHTGWPLRWDDGKPIFRDNTRCLMCPYKIDSMRPMPFHRSINFNAEPVSWEQLVAWMIKVGVLDITRANETWLHNEHACGNCGRVVGHWPPMAAYTRQHCICGTLAWTEYRLGNSKELNHSLGIRTRWEPHKLAWVPKPFPKIESIEVDNLPINRHIGTEMQIRNIPGTKPALLDTELNAYLQQPGGYRYPNESVRGLRDPDQTGIANTSTEWVTSLTLHDPELEQNIKWLGEQLRRVEKEQGDSATFCITATSNWQLGNIYTVNLKAGTTRATVSESNSRSETWYLPVLGGRSLATYRITPYFVRGLHRRWICHNGRDSSGDLDTSRLIGNIYAVNDPCISGYDSFNCSYGPMLFMHWGRGSYLENGLETFIQRMHTYSDIYCADEKILIAAHQQTKIPIQGWQDISITKGIYQASGHPRSWRSPEQLIRFYSRDRPVREITVPEVAYESLGLAIQKALEEKDRD